MRKLTSILAALAVLATCNVLPAAATTVPMVVTVDGNGTVTGSGVTGTLVAHNTYSTWTLNFPALTSSAIVGTFGGTCTALTVLLGNGNCGAAGISNITFSMPSGFTVSGSPCTSSSCTFTVTTTLNGVLVGNGSGIGVASGTCNSSTFVTGAGSCGVPSASTTIGQFSGTCNSGTYLNGGGSCTAPIITTEVSADETRTTTTGSNDTYLTYSGLAAGTYKLSCMVSWAAITNSALIAVSVVATNESGWYSTKWQNNLNNTAGVSGGPLGGPTSTFGGASGITSAFGTIDAFAIVPASGSISVFWALNSAGASGTMKTGSSCTLAKTA